MGPLMPATMADRRVGSGKKEDTGAGETGQNVVNTVKIVTGTESAELDSSYPGFARLLAVGP